MAFLALILLTIAFAGLAIYLVVFAVTELFDLLNDEIEK